MTKPVVQCRCCGGVIVKITRTQQQLTVQGHRRLHVAVECQQCGHEWWSRRREVVRYSRQLDRTAKGR
jgi:uncharacterized protein with PIN domain